MEEQSVKPLTCFINDQGAWVCDSLASPDLVSQAVLDSVKQALTPVIGPNGTQVILDVINQVAGAMIVDDCIPHRAREIHDSVGNLLALNPNSLVFYRFSKMPGQVLSTYYMSQHQYDTVRSVLDHYATPKDPC